MILGIISEHVALLVPCFRISFLGLATHKRDTQDRYESMKANGIRRLSCTLSRGILWSLFINDHENATETAPAEDLGCVLVFSCFQPCIPTRCQLFRLLQYALNSPSPKSGFARTWTPFLGSPYLKGLGVYIPAPYT